MNSEKSQKPKKRFWFKIINKNKENVILVPPHKKEEKVDLKTYSWEEFNSLFVFDEKDKNKCYLINEPEHESKKEDNDLKPKKKNFKKYKKPVVRTNSRPKVRPPRGAEMECTMSIGEMIKNSTKN